MMTLLHLLRICLTLSLLRGFQAVFENYINKVKPTSCCDYCNFPLKYCIYANIIAKEEEPLFLKRLHKVTQPNPIGTYP